MSLGGAPPLLSVLPTDFGTDDAIPPIVSVLAAGPSGLVSGSLEEALLATAGPSRILSGTLASSGSANTIKLVTQQGVEITLARPPGLSIPLGSAISLRITTAGLTPQALVLTVNGRPFSYALSKSSDDTAATAKPAPPQTQTLASARSYAVLPTDQTAALATSALVDLNRAIPVASGSVAAIAAGNTSGLAQTLVALLVKAVPPSRNGSSVPAAGTRYRLAVLNIEPPPEVLESDSPLASLPAGNKPSGTTPASTAANPQEKLPTPLADEISASQSSQADAPEQPEEEDKIGDEASFVAQDAEISGRVTAVEVKADGRLQALVETTFGTLSIPIATKPIEVGSTISLKITQASAARADLVSGAVAEEASPPTLVETLDQTIRAAPSALQQMTLTALQHQLLLEPGPQLAAAILEFLQPYNKANPRRAVSETAIRDAIKSLGGTAELSEGIASAASSIGKTDAGQAAPGQTPPGMAGNDWMITILPFIGAASIRPARFYSKTVKDGDGKGTSQTDAHRFVLDIELKRLGPLQFDGLLYERRFDLMLRSRSKLDSDLRGLVQRTFREALGVCGFSGEIGFGGLLSLPMPGAPKPLEIHRIEA